MGANAESKVLINIETRGERGRVAWITVNYPERINILNTPIMRQLTAAFDDLSSDEEVRVAVLSGAGDRSFIGGADINEMVGLGPATAKEFISTLHGFCAAIRACPVPVIARIQGYCLGGGLEAAVSCDLRVATEDSTFGMPEVKVGLPSVIEAALLPSIVGWGKARELIYTGESIDARDALNVGLVERVVPRDELDAAVMRWIDSILTAGPRAIRLQKALIREWESLPPDKAIERGIEVFGETYRTDEPKRFMERFLNRPRS